MDETVEKQDDKIYDNYDAFMYMYLIKFKGLSFDYVSKHRFTHRIINGSKGPLFTIEKNRKFFAQLFLGTVDEIIHGIDNTNNVETVEKDIKAL